MTEYCPNLLSRALRIAMTAFEGKNDKGGEPYSLHLITVMLAVKPLGHVAMIVGVLHDLLEDCPSWTFIKLSGEGFPESVLIPLMLLTHKKETDYMAYIRNLADNPIARAVKMADLEHNASVTRLKGLAKKDLDRLQKYATAYTYLKEI